MTVVEKIRPFSRLIKEISVDEKTEKKIVEVSDIIGGINKEEEKNTIVLRPNNQGKKKELDIKKIMIEVGCKGLRIPLLRVSLNSFYLPEKFFSGDVFFLYDNIPYRIKFPVVVLTEEKKIYIKKEQKKIIVEIVELPVQPAQPVVNVEIKEAIIRLQDKFNPQKRIRKEEKEKK